MALNIFRNRRAETLEKLLDWEQRRNQSELNLLELRHEKHLADIQSLHQTLQYEAMRELAETKKAHAAELERVITDLKKLQDEYNRVLRLLHPALQTVELPHEMNSSPLRPSEIPTGTPWQRVQRFYMQQQEEEAKAKKNLVKPADKPVEGDTNGSSSERRNDAPQRRQGEPARQ